MADSTIDDDTSDSTPLGATDDPTADSYYLDGDSNMVRPYVITGGRTRATPADLAIETVVSVASQTEPDDLGFERAKIATLCAEPLSIAEISSYLDVPLGVSRVLVTDMVSEGLLDSHHRANAHDAGFIEALIEGIRAL